MAALTHGASLVYAGIDEAGYGPRIGPLAVGLSVFRLSPHEGAPDEGGGRAVVDALPCLWKRLRSVVGKSDDRRRPTVYVDDSKRLKGANGLKTRHPLDRLEQSVLAFLAVGGARPATDQEVFAALGASLDLAPWYEGDPLPAPVTTSAEHIGVMATALRAGLQRAEVETLALRCELVGEAQFNEIVADTGSKAVVNFGAATAHLRHVWREYGRERPIVAVDRQGGRVCYGRPLSAAFPEATVRVIDEVRERSVYEVIERSGRAAAPRRMIVTFEIESDGRHLPTALASMSAKLAREMAMARLNRYWSLRIPELKPTAGYGADANRWLRLVEPHLRTRDRAQLVRRA